jgi:hypothetical protein
MQKLSWTLFHSGTPKARGLDKLAYLDRINLSLQYQATALHRAQSIELLNPRIGVESQAKLPPKRRPVLA